MREKLKKLKKENENDYNSLEWSNENRKKEIWKKWNIEYRNRKEKNWKNEKRVWISDRNCKKITKPNLKKKVLNKKERKEITKKEETWRKMKARKRIKKRVLKIK